MLILTRKKGQTIFIDKTSLTLKNYNFNKVMLKSSKWTRCRIFNYGEFYLENNIRVLLIKNGNRGIKFGIDAPKDVLILREELKTDKD